MRRPPLSSKSYISLVTMSVPSPTRSKTPRSSKVGLWRRPKPARPAAPANAATKASQRRDSGGSVSRVPTGALKVDATR